MSKKMRSIFLSIVLFLSIITFSTDASSKWVEQKESVQVPDGVTILGDTCYTMIEYMDFSTLRSTLIGLERFSYKKIVIDLKTSGGGVFEAMGMVSVIEEYKAKGKIIEIRGRGIVASAGVLILLSGSPGYRFLDKNSMVMLHELWTFSFMKVETPTDKEQESVIFRKIQNQINKYIVDHSKISMEELNSKISKKELWLDANEAKTLGFCDEIF